MTDQPFRMCLVGLPKTGKTTYIAALWAYLNSGLSADSYRVTEFPDDPAYLNAIAEAWSEGADMPRSSLGASERIEFTIETPSGRAITVVLPDLPGEVFLNALRRPAIDEDPAVAVTSSDLLLMFVSGETAKAFEALGDLETVREPEAAEPPAHSERAGTGEAGEGGGSGPKEFAIGDLDSDTLNTELLHRLGALTADTGLPPIVVVVSAWDVHADDGRTPKQWLQAVQPMLSQYLEEVERTSPVGVVGISAQGASYKVDRTVIRLNASERPWGCDSKGGRTDIAGPLLWYDSLGGERPNG